MDYEERGEREALLQRVSFQACFVVFNSLMTPYSGCVPRPLHAFVTYEILCSEGLVHLSHDVYRSLRHNHSTGIDDVIALKEAPSDQSIGSCANLPKC